MKRQTLIIIGLAVAMSGCAACRESPRACATEGLIAGGLAYALIHHGIGYQTPQTKRSTPNPGCAANPALCQ